MILSSRSSLLGECDQRLDEYDQNSKTRGKQREIYLNVGTKHKNQTGQHSPVSIII